jgi:hypothetical protein
MQPNVEVRKEVTAVLHALLDSVQQCQEGLSQAGQSCTTANANHKAVESELPGPSLRDTNLPPEDCTAMKGVNAGKDSCTHQSCNGTDMPRTLPLHSKPSCSSRATGGLPPKRRQCCQKSGQCQPSQTCLIPRQQLCSPAGGKDSVLPKTLGVAPTDPHECQEQGSRSPRSPAFVQRTPRLPAHSPHFKARQTHKCVALQQLLRSSEASRPPSPWNQAHASHSTLQEECPLSSAESHFPQMQAGEARRQVDHVHEVSSAIAAHAQRVCARMN